MLTSDARAHSKCPGVLALLVLVTALNGSLGAGDLAKERMMRILDEDQQEKAKRSEGPTPPTPAAAPGIDHVILAIGRLEAGIDEFTRLTGVTPQRGGRHPGRGTENALVSLGDGRYLEILAPVMPAQASEPMAALTRLTPFGWALHGVDLGPLLARLQAAGFNTVGPTPGSRRRPDGSVLEWQSGEVTGPGLDDAPFFITWAVGAPHPSATAPGGCRLIGWTVTDPQPAQLERFFATVGYKATVQTGQQALRLTIECPRGRVSF